MAFQPRAYQEPSTLNIVLLIGIANAIIWCGVIVFLLLRMMRQQGQLEQQIDRLEEKVGKTPDN